MGACGTGSFDNDDALDWVSELERAGLDAVASALAGVAATDAAEVDASAGARAVAAAEVVAALRGAPASDLPEGVRAWVDGQDREQPDELIASARAAADRVVTGPSELLERWADAGAAEATAWKAAVASVRDRLA